MTEQPTLPEVEAVSVVSGSPPVRPRRRTRALVVWLASALGLLGAIAAFAFILAATDPSNGQTATGPTPPRSPGLSPSFGLISMAPGAIGMPENADCAACHVSDGGAVGVRVIPALAHPVHGWTECTSCHDNARLVATAPGHTGIHAEQCLVCHQQSTAPAPTPRHPSLPDSDCLACHGSIAPLPSGMADKPRTLCWLCHHG
jgi:hypothetical protein